MPKMHSLGEKNNFPDIAVSSSDDPDIIFPRETFTENQIPELKGKELKDEFELRIKVKVEGVNAPDEFDRVKSTKYRLKFLEAGVYQYGEKETRRIRFRIN